MSKKDFVNLIIVTKSMDLSNEQIIEMFEKLKTFYPKIDIFKVKKYLERNY
jgi:hypothetical protein